MSANVETSRFRMEGMDCASTAVRCLPGVEEVSVPVAGAFMTGKHKDLGVMAKRRTSLGYKTAPLPPCNPGNTPQVTADDHSGHDHAGHGHGPGKKPKQADALSGMHGHDSGFVGGPWRQSTKPKLTILYAVAMRLLAWNGIGTRA